MFIKNRDRLLEFDAVTELFNATVETAQKRGLLSGEHFSVDGTLIQAWAGHKSIRRKDGSDDDRPPGNWHGQPRSKQTHESKSDGDSRLYRKSNAAPALPSYLGHVLYRAVEPVRRYYDVRSGSLMIDCVFQQVC